MPMMIFQIEAEFPTVVAVLVVFSAVGTQLVVWFDLQGVVPNPGCIIDHPLVTGFS
jgi:hypothetical protein